MLADLGHAEALPGEDVTEVDLASAEQIRPQPVTRTRRARFSARLWSCEFVRSAQPGGELPVHLCWSGEPDFHVPAIRGRLLAFLDSRAPDVAC